MTDTAIVRLEGVRMPETGPLRRHVRPKARRTELYLERFDRRTLIYDAVRQADGDVLLTAPRLLNLWPLLRDGLRSDGQPVTRKALRRRTSLRFEQLRLRGPVRRLEIVLPDGSTAPVPLRDSLSERLTGRRTLMAVNKNNPIVWIADWARFHAARHGADAVLLFDNGSDAYRPEDIAGALAQVAGLAQAIIVSAPFPYGPADKGGRFDVPPRFFQTAMLNLGRADFLQQARSVLSVDIDELVDGPDDTSIFAAAETHRLGMITIPGIWAFPALGTSGPAPQRAHLWQPETPQPCHQKWCIAPTGPMGRTAWNVHKLGGPLQPLFTLSDSFRLLHCRAASTGWKPDRFVLPDGLRQDPQITALFESGFSEVS